MVGRKVTVSNPSGLHIKPAGQLVKAAERCSSRVEIIMITALSMREVF